MSDLVIAGRDFDDRDDLDKSIGDDMQDLKSLFVRAAAIPLLMQYIGNASSSI